MIPHDLIGSRPVPLDTEQRREERDVEMLARLGAVAFLCLLGRCGYVLWGWL